MTNDNGDANSGSNGIKPDDDVETGAGSGNISEHEVRLLTAPPPDAIAELADACIRFVERAVGVKLDFTPETLPLLDHYLAGARDVLRGRTKGAPIESMELVGQAAGAYFGEVIRRRYASWWRLGASSGDEHQLEFHRLHLVIHPVVLVNDALTLDTQRPASDLSGFDLDPEDVEPAALRLAELPPVDHEEFVRPSTRLEVLDIVVDAARTDHAAGGADPLELEPNDYVH